MANGTLAQSLRDQPSTQPVLRLDTGAHTAPIRAIATDSRGRWAATAGADMITRIWDLNTSRMVRVLRTPVEFDSRDIQSLSAVAFSPDGNIVAVGGSLGNDWGSEALVFLFDRATGELRRRIGLPVHGQWFSAINFLTFSPDGRWLAVALTHDGFQVLDASSGKSIGGDAHCPDYTGLSFRRDGRALAAVCTAAPGGWLGLYGVETQSLQRIGEMNSTQDPYIPRVPGSVSFSPDGKYLLVGSADQMPRIYVADKDLKLGGELVRDGIPNGAGLDVARWASNEEIYAVGNYRRGDQYQMRVWHPKGGFSDIPVGRERAYGLAALPDGRVLFAGGEPSWGIAAPEHLIGRNPDHSPLAVDALSLSADGRTVRFGPVFEVGRGRLDMQTDTPLFPTVTRTPTINLAPDSRNPDAILLNGRSIPIHKYTWGSAAPDCQAIANDSTHFALCTRSSLIYFDAAGNELWHRAAPGLKVRAVNISHDGRWVVAAYADGTIRWHRSETGAEELALYVDQDRQRWIAWTPNGYYDCSPGAEDLVGWHVNRTKDEAADFYPLSRFRDLYYRPDVFAKLFEPGRPTLTDVGVQNVLPPTTSILTPAEGTTVSDSRVTLRIAIRSPVDAPVTRLRVRVNGLLATNVEIRDVSGSRRDESEREISVPIPAKDARIEVFAENKNAVSSPAVVQLLWHGKTTAPEITPRKPTLYLLAVGINQYREPSIRLNVAANDATAFSQAMQAQKGLVYGDVEVKLLTDGAATRDNVRAGLDWLKTATGPNDYAMVMLAGHGFNDPQGHYYFVPVDVNVQSATDTSVVFADIKNALTQIAGTAVFFIDTCHAGNALGGRRDMTYLINSLSSSENGVVVLAASRGSQESLEDPSWGHGAFTKAILEGIAGKADLSNNGHITVKGLDYYLSNRVVDLTRGQQTPVTIAPFGLADFQIAGSSH